MSDPYEELGVAPSATDAEIHRAYVRLARRWHPDLNDGSAEAEDRMRAVNEAWAVLGDQRRRSAFDRAQRDRPAPDPGFRPHDPVDDGFDPRAQPDVPYRRVPKEARSRREVLTLAPVVIFLAAVVVGGAGFFFDAPVVIGAGVVLFSLACIAMIVVLLMTLVDARHDEG